MRSIPEKMTQIWASGDYTGYNRPMARVTVQRPRTDWQFGTHPVPKFLSELDPPSGAGYRFVESKQSSNTNLYKNHYHNVGRSLVRELPNVHRINWQRSIDTQVASCTIDLWNQIELPAYQQIEDVPGKPGWYTYNYGQSQYSSLWKHDENEFSGLLMPDNIVHVYQGYGYNFGYGPQQDPNMVLTGVWRIKDVVMEAGSQLITLRCEDMMSLMADQIVTPDTVPYDWYPLSFAPVPGVETEQRTGTAPGNKIRLKMDYTSNRPWNGDAPMRGHRKESVLDGKSSTYWLSVGNAHPSRDFAFEYVQLDCGGATQVGEVSFSTAKSGYDAYLSLFVNGAWVPGPIIAWSSSGVGLNNGDKPYVQKLHVTSEGTHTFSFAPVQGVTKIRVTLGNLQNFGIGSLKYRGAFRQISASTGPIAKSWTITNQPYPDDAQAGEYPGIYRDTTDAIKLMCAWGGFYWPSVSERFYAQGGTTPTVTVVQPDPVLGTDGRVWGDFMHTGMVGPVPYAADKFDKLSLLDACNVFRDVVGFNFYCDESGGVIWRLPNLFGAGNYVDGVYNTSTILTLDDNTFQTAMTSTLTSRNVREKIFISNPDGSNASVVAGFNPNPTGLSRVGGWVDQGFSSPEEANLMADMIALRQMFSWRQDEVTIPALPSIQIDDQIILVESTIGEGYRHYVSGISSSFDARTGQWMYTLSTHWLGEHPDGVWAFEGNELSYETKKFVEELTR